MYLYIIERWYEEIPFDGSKAAINIHGKLFDIVESRKMEPLERIADYIINLDNKCFDKSIMREEHLVQKEIEKLYNTKISKIM